MIQLLTTNPKGFRNGLVSIGYEDDLVKIILSEDSNSFDEMLKQRKKSVSDDEIQAQLMDGAYSPANLGVSALLVAYFHGTAYLLAPIAKRSDRQSEDTVVKLLSGYVPAEKLHDPEAHILKEISEEFLLMSGSEIHPGEYKGNLLEMPYAGVYPYSPYHFYLSKGGRFELPGIKKKVDIESSRGKKRFSSDVQFHIAADTNSSQLIFRFGVSMQYLAKVTLNHAEEKFNPISKNLETFLHPKGFVLLQIDENSKLNGFAYTLSEGCLLPYGQPILLSEAFAPKTNGISSIGSISLVDYLKTQ